MIEKIGHVNNPLTIIAIFAGLAEVSGTTILPLLKENIQSTYIWFLMIFPSALVAMFFLVLFFRREILYAPSDFRDDASFIGLFQPSQKSRLDIINDDVKEEGIKKEEKTEPDQSAQTQSRQINDIRAISLYTEELILKELSKELNVHFERNVSPKYNHNLNFDAIGTTSDRMFVVEIKYSQHGIFRSVRMPSVFTQINAFYSTLNKEMKQKFTFIFAVAVDDVKKESMIHSIEKEICIQANNFPFMTIAKVYNFKELSEKYQNPV